MFDREVNQFSAAAKFVHLRYFVLMEFDSSRRNRKLAGNLEFLSDVASAPRAFLLPSIGALGLFDRLFRQGRVMKVLPFKAAWMATTNSSEVECLTTKPKAPP